MKSLFRLQSKPHDGNMAQSGALASGLRDNPQKVAGLAGPAFTAIIMSLWTAIMGAVIGLALVWRIAVVGVACMPVIIATGYIRLQAVVLKDQFNKKVHEKSAQVACEAAALCVPLLP
ncbi:hypothetical protein JOM56_015463 [Amanita muscaria]